MREKEYELQHLRSIKHHADADSTDELDLWYSGVMHPPPDGVVPHVTQLAAAYLAQPPPVVQQPPPDTNFTLEIGSLIPTLVGSNFFGNLPVESALLVIKESPNYSQAFRTFICCPSTS